jgi:hypothetical protein
MEQLITSIQSMTPTQYAICMTICAIIATACFFGVSVCLKTIRFIQNTPRSKIRSAVQGYVELTGKAQALGEKPILSPLTNTACCWYAYTIEEEFEERKDDGSTQTEWREIDSGHSNDRLFVLKDETGECVINPQKAVMKPMKINSWYDNSLGNYQGGDLGNEIWDGVVSLITIGNRYKLTEKLILEEDVLYALGNFTTCAATENPMRQVEPDEGKLSKMVAKFVKNAQLSASDWSDYTQSMAETDAVNYLHKSTQPYIISTYSEKKLIASYKWKALFAFLGGVVGVIALIVVWYYRTHV